MKTMMAVALALALAAGCSRIPDPKNEQVFKPAPQYAVSAYEYRIDPPDQIVVRAKNVAELDAQPRTVSPEGKITFNLIGDIYVVGMTPDQLSAKLTEMMKKYYKDPDIKVEVVVQSKFYSLFGPGFSAPQKFGYTGRNTVVSAVADAGIQYDTAWPEKVVINRPRKDARVIVDFMKMCRDGDLSQNFLLEEGDMLWMDHDNLTRVSLTMTKVLGPLTGASQITSTTGNVVRPGTVK